MSCSLAICIATYERPELIAEYLKNCAGNYADAGVDIYFYDSSKTDSTEKTVQSWPDKEHVFYVRIPSEKHLSEKMLMILQGYGLKKNYDFISLSNDATQYSKAAMKYLTSKLNSGYDFAVYMYYAKKKFIKPPDDPGTETISRPQQFFLQCGVECLHLGTTFINVRTMLKNVDWSKYEYLFVHTGSADEWHSMGGYFAFYFNRFLELKRFRSLVVYFTKQRTMRWTSALKKNTIYDQDLLPYMCESWPRTYGLLDERYHRRWKVCRRAASAYITGTPSDFILFRRLGLFSPEILSKYWDRWRKISKVPRPLLAVIAALPQETLQKRYERRKRNGLQKLERFCRTHSNILIYGAGTSGQILDNYMTERGMTFKGFCVTIRKPGKETFDGYPVYVFKKLSKDKLSNIAFILAMRRGNANQVLYELKKRHVKPKQIFYYDEFLADIRSEMGYVCYSGYLN